MNTIKLIHFIILALLFAGCSTPVVKNSNSAPAAKQESTGTFFQKGPSDQDLFDEALSYLSNKEKEPNLMEAKTRLENLVQQYPKTKWMTSAQALIESLEKIATLQTRIKQDKQKTQADQGKLLKEIEGLKDHNKQIEDRYSTEMTKLQQENEQLKNDIQQLKKLEVQLEKREKMLR